MIEKKNGIEENRISSLVMILEIHIFKKCALKYTFLIISLEKGISKV